MGFPRTDTISIKRIEIYRNAGVDIVGRMDTPNPEKLSTKKMNFAVNNSIYLANLMVSRLTPYLHDDTIVAFEGLSFGSTGDAVIQLGGYKYILMEKLNEFGVPFENMYTYAPITIKKTAECSKRGLKKKDVIDSFLKTEKVLAPHIGANKEDFMTRGLKNYIPLLDDLVDAYWVTKTVIYKENLII